MKDSVPTVETGVDKLLQILKENEYMEINKLASALSTSKKTVEQWANFLMEEGVVDIEYTFTKTIVKLKEKNSSKGASRLDSYRGNFKKSSPRKNANEFLEYSWRNQIIDILETKKGFFYEEAQKRNIKDIDKAWKEYRSKVLNL